MSLSTFQPAPSPALPATAPEEYAARVLARRASRDALNAADARIAHARLATFGASAVLAVLTWQSVVDPWLLLVPAVVFAGLARHHARILRDRDLSVRGIGFYERGIARLEDRWPGSGDSGDRFRDDLHV